MEWREREAGRRKKRFLRTSPWRREGTLKNVRSLEELAEGARLGRAKLALTAVLGG